MEDDKSFVDSTIANLDRLSHVFGRFDGTVHISEKRKPHSTRPINLNPLTSLYYAADLACVLADNTERFRDALKQNDQITEDETWPAPKALTTTEAQDLWRTISMTASLDRQTFEMMTTFYKDFPKVTWEREGHNALHDVLLELLQNTIEYIRSEIKAGEFPYDPIKIEEPPSIPAPKEAGPELPALQKLELSLRRLLQTHMQIASFIPAHLRHAILRARNVKAQVADQSMEAVVPHLPFKFDPKPPPPKGGAD